jgi:hypothetical protein
MKHVFVRATKWAAATALLAATAASAADEKAFPRGVALAGAEPRVATVRVDPFSGRNAYLLFDGSVKDGYGRMYVWSPGDSRYGTPQTVASAVAGEQNRFPALAFQSTAEGLAAQVTWQISWEKRKGGSGGNYYDYITGKVVERERKEFDYVEFGFQVDYARGAGGKAELDVGIRGGLGTPGSPTNLPPTFAPWEHLNYAVSAKPFYGEKNKAGLTCAGRLYYGGSECVVRSLPRDTVVTLSVAPYLDPPVYSNALTLTEAFGADGVKVEQLPYGWYDVNWSFACPGLTAYSRLDTVLRPLPITPPLVPGGGM